MNLLTSDEIAEFCGENSEWTFDSGSLRRTASAASFMEAIGWVNRIAEIAEEMDHHPDIDIRWRTLHFSLSTHSAGGVTSLDTELALRIEHILRTED